MVGLFPKNPVPIPNALPLPAVAVGRMDWEPNSPPPEDVAGGCLEPENMNDGCAAAWIEGRTEGEG